MVNRIIILFCLTLILFACKDDKDAYWTMEDIETYSVKTEGKEADVDALNFKETKIYNVGGIQTEHWYYNKQKQMTSVEKYDFENSSKYPTGSKFYSVTDSLLSYYVFEHDAKGQKTNIAAYDATNDDLLRIEKFYYDEKGNRIKREICTSLEEVIRTYDFKFDKEGNEKSYRVSNNNGDVIGFESYTITKRDDKNRWTEMWGFKDEQPVTTKRRNFRRFIPEKNDNK